MLVYIWIRFQFAYGVGAVVALFHDVLITLSALALTGREIDCRPSPPCSPWSATRSTTPW